MDLKKIKLKFKKKERKVRKKSYSIDYIFAWRAVVAISVLTLIVSFSHGYLLYRKISSYNEKIDIGEIKEEFSIGEDRVNAVLRFYEKNQADSRDIIQKPLPFKDPST